MRTIALGMLLLLTGCITEREAIVTFYTQAEVDGLIARMQCQRLARTQFQLSLCEPIRR